MGFEPATEVHTRDRRARHDVRMPTTKMQARQLLRSFGIVGLAINEIGEDRIYCLTPPVLQANNKMHRQSRTVVLERVQDEDSGEAFVRAVELTGWIVGDRHEDLWVTPDGSLA